MKIVNGLAVVTSIACIVTSIIQDDLTEALAWLVITMYNVKNFVDNLLNDK